MGLFSRKKKKEDKKDQLEKVEEVKIEKKEKSQKVKKEKVEKDKKESKEKKELKHDHGKAYKNIIRPIITEKASFLGIYNQYVFEADPKVNKIEIKKAIEKLYGVKPIKINSINMGGKKIRFGRKFGKTRSWKKVIITLKPEDKIEIYEGV